MSIEFDTEAFLACVPERNQEAHRELIRLFEKFVGWRFKNPDAVTSAFHGFPEWSTKGSVLQVIGRRGQVDNSRESHDFAIRWDWEPPELAAKWQNHWEDKLKMTVNNKKASLLKQCIRSFGPMNVVRAIKAFELEIRTS